MRVEADGIRDWRPLLDRLRKLPHVIAAAPGIYEQVLVSRGPRAGFALDQRHHSRPRSAPSATCSTPSPPAPPRPRTRRAQSDNRSGQAADALPPIVLGSDLAEQIGAQVGDSVLVTSPQGELTPLGLAPKYAALPRRRHLSLRLLPVRRSHGLHAPGRRAAALRRARPALRHQLQGRQSRPRARRSARASSRPPARAS